MQTNATPTPPISTPIASPEASPQVTDNLIQRKPNKADRYQFFTRISPSGRSEVFSVQRFENETQEDFTRRAAKMAMEVAILPPSAKSLFEQQDMERKKQERKNEEALHIGPLWGNNFDPDNADAEEEQVQTPHDPPFTLSDSPQVVENQAEWEEEPESGCSKVFCCL